MHCLLVLSDFDFVVCLFVCFSDFATSIVSFPFIVFFMPFFSFSDRRLAIIRICTLHCILYTAHAFIVLSKRIYYIHIFLLHLEASGGDKFLHDFFSPFAYLVRKLLYILFPSNRKLIPLNFIFSVSFLHLKTLQIEKKLSYN